LDSCHYFDSYALTHLGPTQAQRLIRFVEKYFDDLATSSGRRRLTGHRKAESVKRGSIIQTVRNAMSPLDTHRTLEEQSGSNPIISFALNPFLDLTLDFNFGAGNKEILFGLHFDFDSGDEAESSIQNMLNSFLQDTVADEGGDSLGGFDFTETASTLAEDLMTSLVIGVHVDIDVRFGLDMNNLFNETAESRFPAPFLKLYKFDVEGIIGVDEWSSMLEVEQFDVAITEARALFGIEVGITSGTPLLLESAQDFLSLISPTDTSGIGLNASLDVRMPVFIAFEGLGFGATMSYVDDDILDDVRPQPSFEQDVMISIELIREAADQLKVITAFLGNYEPLQQNLPLLQVSVNQLIAGQDRTLADLFDLTDFANHLVGTESATKMPSTSPSISNVPSQYPLSAPSVAPSMTAQPSLSIQPSSAPSMTNIPSQHPNSAPSSSPSFPTNRPSFGTNDEYILLTQLISKTRAAFQGLVKPGTELNNVPSVPDVNLFNVVRPSGSICEGSFRAIAIDITREGLSSLNLTLCALLEFELEGSYDATGLLSAVEDNLDIDISGSFQLKGSLMLGAKLSVVKNIGGGISVGIEFDPISTELSVVGDLDATVSLGMVEAAGNGQVLFFGQATLDYCSSCNGIHPLAFQRVKTSSFYFDQLFGFDIDFAIALNAEVPGVEIDTGLALSISDANVFDDNPPVITPPDVQALRDLLKFSPKNALVMLRLIDGECNGSYSD
jgi:hypothetical protein